MASVSEDEKAALDRAEKRFYRDQWEAAPAVAADNGMLLADFGPVQVNIGAGFEPAEIEFVLGTTLPGARGTEVEEAVMFARRHERTALIPVTPETAATEDLERRLVVLGCSADDGAKIRKYLRDDHPPRFPFPDGVEVEEVDGPDGPFGEIVALASGLPTWTASLLAHLPERADWRCYVGRVDGNPVPVAAAAMLIDGEIAQFGLAATLEPGRRKKCQLALLHRRIEDAIDLGIPRFASDVEVGEERNLAASRKNLRDAGFYEAYERRVWVD